MCYAYKFSFRKYIRLPAVFFGTHLYQHLSKKPSGTFRYQAYFPPNPIFSNFEQNFLKNDPLEHIKQLLFGGCDKKIDLKGSFQFGESESVLILAATIPISTAAPEKRFQNPDEPEEFELDVEAVVACAVLPSGVFHSSVLDTCARLLRLVNGFASNIDILSSPFNYNDCCMQAFFNINCI